MPVWTCTATAAASPPDAIVKPEERLAWPVIIGIGAQHVVAMFGATFLVPLLTGFPPSTTLLFSGIGTLLFLTITRNKVPSYLGSSFAFIAPDHGGDSIGLDGCGARRRHDHGSAAGAAGTAGHPRGHRMDRAPDAARGDGLDRRSDRVQPRPHRL